MQTAPHVIVIGGGPAGIMAALSAADHGARVTLWERNQRLGKKLAITGKGRCNITNDTTTSELIENLPGNGMFLHGAFARFTAADTMAFFSQRCQLPLKTERGNRVFPRSDRALDVLDALLLQLSAAGVEIAYQHRAKRLALAGSKLSGVHDYSGRLHAADAVILATGGLSYPSTGSSGDGYALAAQAGHSIVPPRAALVPLECQERWVTALSGLSLKNVRLDVYQGDTCIDSAFGEMLFTHFGVSGPIVLSLSRTICAAPNEGRGIRLVLDLKPALSLEQLDARLQRIREAASRKQYRNSLGELLPASMIPVFIELSQIPAEKTLNQLTKAERQTVAGLMKALPFTVAGPRPIEEAIVTAGGVSVQEVNPATMASKKISNLFFAGELLDIDGYTGGFNLQAAWSSGYVAGQAAAWL